MMRHMRFVMFTCAYGTIKKILPDLTKLSIETESWYDRVSVPGTRCPLSVTA